MPDLSRGSLGLFVLCGGALGLWLAVLQTASPPQASSEPRASTPSVSSPEPAGYPHAAEGVQHMQRASPLELATAQERAPVPSPGRSPRMADRVSDGTRRATTQRQEASTAQPQRSAQLEAQWSSETFDPVWTSELEQYLREVAADLDLRAPNERVRCATTLCRVDIQFDQLEAAKRFQELAVNDQVDKEVFFDPGGDGHGLVVTAYLFRPGTDHDPPPPSDRPAGERPHHPLE